MSGRSQHRMSGKKGLAPRRKYVLAAGKRIESEKDFKVFFGAGFTLIEIMITVFFVSVGLIGVIAFFNSSLESNFEAKNELIAAGLAQEGAELVRNIKDYNQLNSSSGLKWYGNLWSASAGGSSLCRAADYGSLSSHACTNLRYVCFSGGRYFQCADGSPGQTQFERSITLARVGNLDDGGRLEVLSSVKWKDGDMETKATDRLYENEY